MLALSSRAKLNKSTRADATNLRNQRDNVANLKAGYPLAALSIERRAIAELRNVLASVVCDVLELCQVQATEDERTANAAALHAGEDQSRGSDTSHSRAERERGPSNVLVQMVCSGNDARVCCATTAYRLSNGIPGRGRRNASGRTSMGPADDRGDKSEKGQQPDTSPAKTHPTSRMLDTYPSLKPRLPSEKSDVVLDMSPESIMSASPPLLPDNAEEALLAGRVSAAATLSFADQICPPGGYPPDEEAKAPESMARLMPGVGRTGFARDTTLPGPFSLTQVIDTSSTTKVVDALRMDASRAMSLSKFVQKKLAAEAAGRGKQMVLK